MKVNEEVDALETFGISPVDFLVTPRFLAVVLALPMLTLYADVIGILGGMGVAVTMFDLTITQFFTGFLEEADRGVARGRLRGARPTPCPLPRSYDCRLVQSSQPDRPK